MPGIDQYLENIRTAVYGEEVRGSIHDAIQKCYEDMTSGEGGGTPSAAIRYDEAQDLNDEEKATARNNIGAISSEDIPTAQSTIRYDQEQDLNDEEKTTARANIGAAKVSEGEDGITIEM